MTQLNKSYPKKIVTIEKTTEDSAEKQIVTIVNNEYEEKAVEAAIAFQDAFNESDAEKLKTFLNFPHARVGANGELEISEKGVEITPNSFKEFRKLYEWNHSCWDCREVVQSIENKVHLLVTFSRYRIDGSKIGTFPAFWVITKQDNHWGIKARSSFAF